MMMPTTMSLVWTVCLCVRGQQFWGSPHHPEHFQLLGNAFGYLAELKKRLWIEEPTPCFLEELKRTTPLLIVFIAIKNSKLLHRSWVHSGYCVGRNGN